MRTHNLIVCILSAQYTWFEDLKLNVQVNAVTQTSNLLEVVEIPISQSRICKARGPCHIANSPKKLVNLIQILAKFKTMDFPKVPSPVLLSLSIL